MPDREPGASPSPQPAPFSSELPSPSIADFDVGQELGKGGFAIVYRARVRECGREVALKVVDKQRACEHLSKHAAVCHEKRGVELAWARVANEVRLHWGLKHPSIVELIEFFEDDRFVYLVLELCRGGDLYRRIRDRGPLPEREAVMYMGQLLAGLAYLHEQGLMHRDLKLSNLLLSGDARRLKIADFGLAAKLDDEDHERHTICGTPNYMAPEVQGAGYGLSADLWSAGCLFYTMLTGAAPFQGRRVGETLANARAGRYVEPEGLSGLARDFLASMLSLDPSRRMRVEEAAAHPFLRLDMENPPPGVAETLEAGPAADAAGIDMAAEESDEHSGAPASTRLASEADAVKDFGKRGRHSSSSSASRRSATGAGGSAVGISTLTASTAPLMSDRFSASSSFAGDDEPDSSTTLRSEAVPTPATLGEGVAAAAARARRASATGAAFPASVVREPANHRRVPGRAGRPGANPMPVGGVVTTGGTPPKGMEKPRIMRTEVQSSGERVVVEERQLFCSVARRRMKVGGKAHRHGNAGDRPGSAARRERDVVSGSWNRSETRAPPAHESNASYGSERRRRAQGVVRARVEARGVQSAGRQLVPCDSKSHQRRNQNVRTNPNRLRHEVSPQVLRNHGGAELLTTPEAAGTSTAYRADVVVPSPTSSWASNESMPQAPRPRPGRRRQRQAGSGVSVRPPAPLPPQPSSPWYPAVDDDQSLRACSDRLRELRELRSVAESQRRLHEKSWSLMGSQAGDTAQPPPHAAGAGGAVVPLSTTRVRPMSHCSGGRSAVGVFEDGRASIVVGKRWLTSSADGKWIWAGSCRGGSGSSSEAGNSIRSERTQSASDVRAEACLEAARTEAGATAKHRLRSLPDSLLPMYKTLFGVVDAIRSKTPKVVLHSEGSAAEDGRGSRPPILLVCALMDNLPDPDFTATFEGGGSLSLSQRKCELRVDLPGGSTRSWHVGGGEDWPIISCLRAGASAPGVCTRADDVREGRDGAEVVRYLLAGLEGYCRCLSEETNAYRRGASFPLEIAVSVTSGSRSLLRGDYVAEHVRAEQVAVDERAPSMSTKTPTAMLGADRQKTQSRPRGEPGSPGTISVRQSYSWWRGDEESSSSESPAECELRSAQADLLSSVGNKRDVGSGDAVGGSRFARHAEKLDHVSLETTNVRAPGEPHRPRAPRGKIDGDNAAPSLIPSCSGAGGGTKVERSPRGEPIPRDRGRRGPPRYDRTELDGAPRDDGALGAGQHLAATSSLTRSTSMSGEFFALPEGSEKVADHAHASPAEVASPASVIGANSGRRDSRRRSAVVPGVGEAFRDSRGNVEVRFVDGVVVVLDALAKWMRVEPPRSPSAAAIPHRPSPACGATSSAERTETLAITYDLSTSGIAAAAGSTERRMPRDAKEKMKALPRFIRLLQRSAATSFSGESLQDALSSEEHGRALDGNGRAR